MKRSRILILSITLLAGVLALAGCGSSGKPMSPLEQLDTVAPPTPDGLTAAPVEESLPSHVMLTWNFSAAADVERYEVFLYQSLTDQWTLDGTHDAATNRHHMPTSDIDMNYTVRVRAVDASGNESGYSEDFSVFVPAGRGFGEIPAE